MSVAFRLIHRCLHLPVHAVYVGIVCQTQQKSSFGQTGEDGTYMDPYPRHGPVQGAVPGTNTSSHLICEPRLARTSTYQEPQSLVALDSQPPHPLHRLLETCTYEPLS